MTSARRSTSRLKKELFGLVNGYSILATLGPPQHWINDISKKTAQRNYSPVKYCNLFYQSRALLKGNTLCVLKIFVLINPYKCLPVLKITIQDYPAKLYSLKAACTNENCLSKPMDKSSYWETFLTILILEEVKTEANNYQFKPVSNKWVSVPDFN